jgi:transketolase
MARRALQPAPFDIFDYNIYAVCGDGCMMEGRRLGGGIAGRASRLDDLCWIYDNNHITIEGNTRIAFTEDVAARFMGYHWNVLRVGDANDLQRIEDALAVFRATKGRPTLIILDSHIGYGSPHKVDTRPSARRAAGRGRSQTHQARLRLAGGREVSCARRRV